MRIIIYNNYFNILTHVNIVRNIADKTVTSIQILIQLHLRKK